MGRCRSQAIRALAIIAALGAGPPSRAAEVRAGGVRLEVPEGWSERGAPAAAMAGASERLWTLGPSDSPLASLLVSSAAGTTEVSPWRLPAARLELERSIRGRPGTVGFSIDAIGIRRWREAAGYEIAATSTTGAGAVRHLQYLVAGNGAVAVTLSAPADRFERLRPELERIARSLVVEARPSVWDRAPRWLCGTAILALLVLGATPALLRGRHRS